MPCTITGSLAGDAALMAQENAVELTKKLRIATQVACELAEWSASEDLQRMSEQTQKWVKRHHKQDKRRGKQKR